VDPGATIHILGNLTVAAGAVFDAQTVPSTITVGHNVTAGAGALLGLGCQPDFAHNTGHECGSMFDPDDAGDVPTDPDYPCLPEAGNPFACLSSAIKVHGNITAIGANTVLLNGIKVNGNVTLVGGGGNIPWSIKNNTIGRNLTAIGITADWFGALFNHVNGNMTLINITATDPQGHHPTGLRRAQHHRPQPDVLRPRTGPRLRVLPRRGQHRRPPGHRPVRQPRVHLTSRQHDVRLPPLPARVADGRRCSRLHPKCRSDTVPTGTSGRMRECPFMPELEDLQARIADLSRAVVDDDQRDALADLLGEAMSGL
jgi:hypothetical protein